MSRSLTKIKATVTMIRTFICRVKTKTLQTPLTPKVCSTFAPDVGDYQPTLKNTRSTGEELAGTASANSLKSQGQGQGLTSLPNRFRGICRPYFSDRTVPNLLVIDTGSSKIFYISDVLLLFENKVRQRRPDRKLSPTFRLFPPVGCKMK